MTAIDTTTSADCNSANDDGDRNNTVINEGALVELTSPVEELLEPSESSCESVKVNESRPSLFFIPKCFRFENNPREATGISLDFYARGHVVMSSLFLGPALLELAREAAQVNCKSSYGSCKIMGFLPSSLLSNIAIWSGLCGAMAQPIIGAVVDHTDKRLEMAAVSAIYLAIIKGLEVAVGKGTWFMIAVFQVLSAILYNMHATATYAYTSELTNDPNKQSSYNAHYNAILYISMLVFLLLVLGLAGLFQTDDVGTARISQAVTSIVALTCFAFAWRFFFTARPALSQLPPGASLCTIGFSKTFRTFQRIAKHYRALAWAIASMMFAESAMAALATICVTYMKEILGMGGNDVGIVFLIVLCMGIPGSYLGGYLSIQLGNPIRSALLCDVGFIATTSAASFFLTGPDNREMAFVFAALWGGFLGWLPPTDTTIFMHLMPPDSRAEFMGIMMFSSAILSWLPPLVFSVLNESGVHMAWGLASLNLYFVIAIFCLLQIGDYTNARFDASRVPYRHVNDNGMVPERNVETSSAQSTVAQNIRAVPFWRSRPDRKNTNDNIHDVGDHELI